MACWYCGRQTTRPGRHSRPTDATTQRLLPISRGGRDTWENRIQACRRCNALTSPWSVDLKNEFKALLEERDIESLPKARGRIVRMVVSRILAARIGRKQQ